MKSINKILLTVLVLSQAADAGAQALKAGFDNLQRQKYDEAVKVFSKALDKGTETIAAGYGLGCVVSTPDYRGYNNQKGFRLIRNAHDRMAAASPKTKSVCREVYGFGQDEMRQKMNEVAARDLKSVMEKNTIDDFEWFVLTYEGADAQIAEARRMESELAWPQTVGTGTFRAYMDFAQRYPQSQHSDEARSLAEKLWKDLCRDAYSEGEVSSMAKFADQYPQYPYYTDQEKAQRALAMEGEKLKLHMHYSQDYEDIYMAYVDKAAPSELAYVALQRVISPYLQMGRYAEAADILKKYAERFPQHGAHIASLQAMLRKPGNKLKSTPLPPAINTEHMEYAPVITPDGNTLYFCGNGREDNLGNEDIFVSVRKNGAWQPAKGMAQFNTQFGNEAPLAVSPDGNMLLVYKDSNIHFSERKANGWTPLRKFAVLNTGKSWEGDASFAPDGNAIFFISDRNGNVGRHHQHEEPFHGSMHGNSDIYVATRNADGSWNEPINLGPQINTPYAERSPWLASDMKTMYFSSEGHASMGRLDVFKSTRLSDTSWTQWSEPVNLGKEINTASDDYNYIISTDGKSAYFSKFSGGNVDICMVDLPEAMRPEIIGIVYGAVSDNEGKILPARIKWEDLQTGKVLGNLQCNPADGKYFITLPAGRNYGYFVEMPGYYPVSGNLNTERLSQGQNIERNIQMTSISDILDGKAAIRLENIFFETNKYELKKESYPELKRLFDFVRDNPDVQLEISGHTDNSGSQDFNMSLSQRRAESVRNYLVELGASGDRIRAVGYGSSRPVDNNATEAGKARNRRVEFSIKR